MATFWRIFYATLSLLAAIALCVIAYLLIAAYVTPATANSAVAIDYTNMVVILLTTVTVIFSVSALGLAILGVVGFRSLRREAGKFASAEALRAISSSFDDGGRALSKIQDEFTREDGHLKKWTERRIRQEVIALLPLVIDKITANNPDARLAEDEPTDEGRVD